MEKVTLYIESQVSHVWQIITGFLMLRQQGYPLEIIDNRKGNHWICKNYPMIRAQYREKQIVYDLCDGYNIPNDIQRALDESDYHFRRSFSDEKNRLLLHNWEHKMYPLGLYFRVTHRDNPIQ